MSGELTRTNKIPRMVDWRDAYEQFIAQLNTEIAAQFKVLLESRHIYQKTLIDAEAIAAQFRQRIDPNDLHHFARLLKGMNVRLRLADAKPYIEEVFNQADQELSLYLKPENVKLFCEKCDRTEAFRPLWYRDIAIDLKKVSSVAPRLHDAFQMFVFAYQCQSCTELPETLVVRREGWQLFLHGRSPMEHVELPAYIPKVERQWYRDALIALNGGKTLAALFYLRIFIEQFARRQTKLLGKKKTGEEIMSAYMETLPAQQRPMMPSLREWYEKLSEAIHGAKEEVDLFAAAREQIDHHFEIRKVFKIPDSK